MNNLKRIFALALCLALMLTCLVGCHKKGEIAVKIGDVEFTSGYYACALVFSDTEARSQVEESLTTSDGKLPENIDYYKQKIDKKDFVAWVEENTLNTLKDLAAVKTLCKDAKVELDAETISLSDSNADYMWESYGYQALLEANGVSKETFKQYMRDSYLTDEYFEYLYGKGGQKEVAADKISKQLTDNYVLANKLEVSFSELKDEQKADKKEQFANFEKALKDGTKTFEDIYLEYNEIKKEDHKHEEPKEGEKAPKDAHATVLGNEDTSYASDHFETAKKMTVGEVKLITLKDDAGLVLLVKQDIAADPYYIEEFDIMLRQDIVGDDYTDETAKYAEKLTCTVDKYAIKPFKVKKIKYPEAAY